jgi:hypothetical protein
MPLQLPTVIALIYCAGLLMRQQRIDCPKTY